MSVQAITWAFKQEVAPSGLKFVLVALANYASDDGYCYPSQKTLAALTGQSERAVRGHLAALEGAGYLRREVRRRRGGTRNSDGFYLQWDNRQNLPPVGEQPAESAATTGRFCRQQPAESAANTKEEDTKEETKGVSPDLARIAQIRARTLTPREQRRRGG